ncbi:MAG: zinc ribbon domain-containing protein [Deltaproteobacteria bacterium]|nr:zinc ribbon domain-containing protein [Candidatus Zymogenaceae bacterium]
MPIFEFVCGGCGNEFEELVMSRAAEVSCPKCASTQVNKMMSVCGVKSGDKFVSSSSGGSCGGCTSKNCGSCH